MNVDFDLAFPALVLGRLALAYSPLANALIDDHLLSSPLNGYSRCTCLHQLTHHASNTDLAPSAGRHPPLQARDRPLQRGPISPCAFSASARPHRTADMLRADLVVPALFDLFLHHRSHRALDIPVAVDAVRRIGSMELSQPVASPPRCFTQQSRYIDRSVVRRLFSYPRGSRSADAAFVHACAVTCSIRTSSCLPYHCLQQRLRTRWCYWRWCSQAKVRRPAAHSLEAEFTLHSEL